MHADRFLELVDALAPTLRALDAMLGEPRPGMGATARDYNGLDTACADLYRHMQITERTLRTLGEFTSAPRTDRCVDIQRLGAEVSAATQGLSDAYRGAARLAQRAGRDAKHERLVDAARDNLVSTTHFLADLIDSGLTLLASVAITGGEAERDLSVSFDAPADERALDSWTPLRLAYARSLATRALRGAATCREDYAPPAEAAPAPTRGCPGLGLSAIVIGLLIGFSLGGDGD